MDRFRALCRSVVAVLACSTLLLSAGGARADEQPKNPPAVKPAAAPNPPAKPAAPPKPTIAKKEGEGILGKQVYGPDGADMGLVTNVLVDRAGNPIAVVIDFGGFLGMGSRKIAVDWHLMQFHPGDKDKPLTLRLQKDQLKAAPTYKPDTPPRIVGAPAPKTPPPAAAPPPKTPSPDDKTGK
ncbi:MAG TPA: PRC-barrel domain-containing protein [Stellaceae bacterium]|nr:PRC-barrel domain-containing protein [Stellaceae bacterium]